MANHVVITSLSNRRDGTTLNLTNQTDQTIFAREQEVKSASNTSSQRRIQPAAKGGAQFVRKYLAAAQPVG